MARQFDDASNERLEIEQAVLSGTPFVMACWVNLDDITTHKNFMWLGDGDVNDNYFRLFTNASNDIVYANAVNGASYAALTSSTITAGVWHHVCAIFASATDRRILLNGGSKGTNTTNVTPVGLDRTAIGVLAKAARDQYMDGHIAEASIWDLSNWPGATDADKANNFETIIPSLVAGFSPTHFPLGLAAYWPLIRGLNDKVGGYNLTANGTVVSDHPRVIQPHGVQ